jgi:hypothetical protein
LIIFCRLIELSSWLLNTEIFKFRSFQVFYLIVADSNNEFYSRGTYLWIRNALTHYLHTISFTLSITLQFFICKTNPKSFLFFWIGYLCFSIFSFIFRTLLCFLFHVFLIHIYCVLLGDWRTNIFCASCVFRKVE